MKRPALIFAILSVYIIAAFAWWTYAHVSASKQIYEQKLQVLELLPHKATLDLREAVDQEMLKDTNDIKNYFSINYPQLAIQFSDEADPMFNYAIMPKHEAVHQIEKKYTRKMWMYGMEGIVMVVLLFWGIILIYRSLQNRVVLNKQQSNFLLSITHELKTPIASIKLYLETLLKRKNLNEEQAETMMRNSLNDVTRLRDLVENLLMAAQLDTHKFSLSFQQVHLSGLVEETIEKYSLPRNLNNRLILNIAPNIYAAADAIAFEMIITNLLSNAFKYSPADKCVRVELDEHAQHIKLRVIDEGQGISALDKKHLFDKFYRAEDENIRKSKGTGLGLFIVKNLVSLHQASIVATDNIPNGSIFEITLPKHATQNITR